MMMMRSRTAVRTFASSVKKFNGTDRSNAIASLRGWVEVSTFAFPLYTFTLSLDYLKRKTER